MKIQRVLFLMSCLAVSVVWGGCTPAASFAETFTCEDDSQCDENTKYCINSQCVQCRDAADCKGTCQECSTTGKCEKIVGCCGSNNDCPSGRICRGNVCGCECDNDTVCAAGFICENCRCIKETQCNDTKPCRLGQECKDYKCVGVPLCEMVPIYFDFDQAKIRADQKEIIIENVNCIADRSGKLGNEISIHLIGHTDEKEPKKYKGDLGKDRTEAVLNEIVKLGVRKERILTEFKGKLEPVIHCGCKEEKNRRVEFKQR